MSECYLVTESRALILCVGTAAVCAVATVLFGSGALFYRSIAAGSVLLICALLLTVFGRRFSLVGVILVLVFAILANLILRAVASFAGYS